MKYASQIMNVDFLFIILVSLSNPPVLNLILDILFVLINFSLNVSPLFLFLLYDFFLRAFDSTQFLNFFNSFVLFFLESCQFGPLLFELQS